MVLLLRYGWDRSRGLLRRNGGAARGLLLAYRCRLLLMVLLSLLRRDLRLLGMRLCRQRRGYLPELTVLQQGSFQLRAYLVVVFAEIVVVLREACHGSLKVFDEDLSALPRLKGRTAIRRATFCLLLFFRERSVCRRM